MENYLSVRQMAEKWGVSERRINQYCAEGRIPGAHRFGKSWAIPENAQKPTDPRHAGRSAETGGSIHGPLQPESVHLKQPSDGQAKQPSGSADTEKKSGGLLDHTNLMPLMNTAFTPGRCKEAVEAMEEGAQKDIAMAEYHYFSGQPEKAAKEAEPYLTSTDMGARLSAYLLYTYANLSIGQISNARFALGELNASIAAAGERSPQFKAASAFVASAGAVLLHLPLSDEMPEAGNFLPLLPPGLRAFAMYVQAHYMYLKGEYAHSAGTVEATLAMGASLYPISAIYLHLVAVMDYMSLKQPDRAREHLLEAWDIARPDDLIEGFGEHHGLLGAMLEAVIKPKWPKDFKRIIDITYRFSSGWRRVHNPITGHDVADDLTTTEFAMAMLAARGWTNLEIAEHLHISVNTVKSHISEAMRKLDVETRKELKQYMLR